MILTVCYMYATLVQWWRLRALRNKLNGTLNHQNALLLCAGSAVSDPRQKRCLENLLFQKDGRIACTVVPRQRLSLNQWIVFPNDLRCFPIHIGASRGRLEGPKVHVLLQAQLDSYSPHRSEKINVENYGELVAWRVAEHLEVILKTDLNYLTKLMNCFSYSEMDINHELQLVKLETIDVEGYPSKVKYEKKYATTNLLKYSKAPDNWRLFVSGFRDLYSKLIENVHPKITIENGTKPEDKKVPISEVKPIKKSPTEKVQATRNTLDVHHSSGHKKHKSEEKKSVDPTRHSKSSHSKSPEAKTKPTEAIPKSSKPPESAANSKSSHVKPAESAANSKSSHVKPVESGANSKSSHAKPAESAANSKASHSKSSSMAKTVEALPSLKNSKSEAVNSKSEVANSKSSHSKAAEAAKAARVKSKPEIKVKDAEEKLEARKAPKTDSSKLLPTKAKEDESKKLKSYSEAAQTPASAAAAASKNLQRQNATSSKETSPNRVVKPPNILVYADSAVAKENVKSVLKSIINKEKYIIYDLPVNTSASFWDSSTTLVIVCGNVTANLTPHLLQYLVTGGQMLCLCSDLLYSVLSTFTTAEVREHELVRFTYGKWERVKMMHHIFCYQASPAKKQFSKDSDQSSNHSSGSSPVAPRTPSMVDIQHNGKNYTIQVQVLGAEETWQTPSLLLATVKDSVGKAIFSQVHLEVDPMQYQDDESKYAALKDSDGARLEILKHILSSHLDIDCRNSNDNVEFTPAYFLGRHDLKLEVLNNCEHVKDSKLVCDEIQLEFCGKGVDPGKATSSRLPVLILSCPANFSTVGYFETLQTEEIGRIAIYCDILTSTQKVLQKKLKNGLVVVARQQTEGQGRSNNKWISPQGCAMFSLQLHIDLNSTLGGHLSLVQHLVMTAVISALKSVNGLEDLDVGLKWPNDLYAYSSVKIGGLIVSSTVETETAIINIGCGINLENSEPTLCVNDVIQKHNKDAKSNVPAFQQEKFLALTFNEIERILKIVQGGDIDYLFDLYYKYWLHNNARISVSNSQGELKDVQITGIDNYGFLLVRSEDGGTSSVQPDGNSFDMLKGLIAPKIT